MPTDFSISIATKGGLENILFGSRGERMQAMRGFESTYTAIVDYIVRITHRIWEEKDLGYIYNTYRANAQVTDGAGLKANREQMINESVAAVSAFPDAVLYADDIIWAGNEDRGFHTSHRVVTVATNTGPSDFGPPTGRRTASWSVANCVVAENEIFEEWLLDNTGSVIVQLGLDLFATARDVGNLSDGSALATMTGQVERLAGQGRPLLLTPPDGGGDDVDIDAYLRYVLHTVWNWRNLSIVDKAYTLNVRYHGATGREFYGRGDIKAFILSMLTMFPDLTHHVDEIYYMGTAAIGYKVSLRWSIIGTHRGVGMYGRPTGRRIRTWGISQYLIRDGRITEEWTMFNEFELLQQILRDEPAQ